MRLYLVAVFVSYAIMVTTNDQKNKKGGERETVFFCNPVRYKPKFEKLRKQKVLFIEEIVEMRKCKSFLLFPESSHPSRNKNTNSIFNHIYFVVSKYFNLSQSTISLFGKEFSFTMRNMTTILLPTCRCSLYRSSSPRLDKTTSLVFSVC